MNNFTPEQKTLVSLLGHNLFGAPLEIAPDTDWEKVAKESAAQTVFSVAFNNYRELPISDELSKKIKKYLMKLALSNADCFQNHTYLHELMEVNGIPYCSFKGASSALGYPDPLLRAMGDVDFYVHPDDIDRAMKVFQAEGFNRYPGNHESHIGLDKDRKHFEMHFKPVAYHKGWIGDIFEEYWQDIISTAVLHKNELAVFNGPSIFHHGFILLTHLQHHLYSEGVGLRHLCDWVLFANSLSNDEFVSMFETKLKRIGLWRLAQLLCLGAVKFMGMEHKAWMGDDYSTAEELLSDILYGGNFGRKDKQRSYEGLFIFDKNEGDIKKGRISIMFKSLNRMVDGNWKSAKKFVLLYPVGWVYFSLRYILRVIMGKRKMNLVGTYQKSGQRRNLYSKIRCFEPEK